MKGRKDIGLVSNSNSNKLIAVSIQSASFVKHLVFCNILQQIEKQCEYYGGSLGQSQVSESTLSQAQPKISLINSGKASAHLKRYSIQKVVAKR